jgi:hypothetical protein
MAHKGGGGKVGRAGGKRRKRVNQSTTSPNSTISRLTPKRTATVIRGTTGRARKLSGRRRS